MTTLNKKVHGMVDKQFFLGKPCVYVEEERVLIETDLRWYFEVDGTRHKISTIHLIKWEFAFVSVVDHCLKLIKIA
jgi:hypothetical protein